MGTSVAVTVLTENEKPETGVVDVEVVVDGTVVGTRTVVDTDDCGTDERSDELERGDLPADPQEAAATRITVSSAYGIRESREGRKEVEADIG